MLKKNLKFDKHVIIFHIICIAIIIKLFGSGDIVGGGESGAPFYDLSRMFKLSNTTWVDILLGYYTGGLSVASSPFYALMTLLQQWGIPNFLLQASFFYISLFFCMYGMYLFSKELVESLSYESAFVAALIYLFNLYSIANIWNRFLPNLILFYSVLPLLLYFYLKAIKRLKIKFVIITVLLSTFFSFAFSAPAQSIVFFGLCFLTTLFYTIIEGNWIKRLWYLFLFVFLFIFSNSWWFSQQFYFRFSKSYESVESQFFNPLGNIDTFESLSKRLGKISDLFLLKHANFYKDVDGYYNNWPRIYSLRIIDVLGLIILLIGIFGAYKKIKNKGVYLSLLIFTIGVFLSKGNAPPFGEFFNYIFQKISYIQFFRNPFEKLGLLIALGLAPLVGVGMDLFKNKAKNYILASIILLVYGYPFYSGLIFTGNMYPANQPEIGIKVKVPSYYKQLDDWLINQNDEYRFVVLPMGGEGIFYNWEKGYIGIEQSPVLFEKAGISYSTTMPFYAEVASELERIILYHDNFYNSLKFLNVKYVIFRPDIVYEPAAMRDPQVIYNRLEQIYNNSDVFTDKKQFGKLWVYVINDKYLLPRIFMSDTFVLDNHPNITNTNIVQNMNINSNLVDMYNFDHLKIDGSIYEPYSNILIERINGNYKFSDNPTILPFVTKLPSSKTYDLALIKDQIVKKMILDTDEKLEFDITMLGKRVMEIKMAYDLNQFDLIPDILNRYDKQLDKLLTEVRNNSIKPITPTGVWKRDYLELALGTHIRVLNEVYGKSSSDDNFNQGLKQLIDKIIFKGNQLYLFPSHNIDNLDQFERINEFEFKAVKNGEYDLIFPGLVKCASIIDPSQIKIDYEGNLINGTIIGDDIVFKVNIQADNVVFRLLTSQLNNLYTEIDDITLNSNKNKQYEYEITNFCPGLSYKINVDYYVRSGFSPKLSFIQNNDKLVNGEYERSFDLRLPQGNYWFDTQNYGIVVGSRNTADKAKLSLMVDKWSNCAEFGNNFKKCEDQQFLNLNSKESESVINNINITLFEYPKPYLIKLNNESNVEYDLINYQRLAPYKYLLKLSNIKSSKILVLSETFNSGWNIGGLNRPHFVVNAYANGWLINPGDEGEYIVEFGPQKLLEYANLVSGLSIIILVLFLYVKKND